MRKRISVLLIYCLVIASCGSYPPNYVCLDVPFHYADTFDCCAVACIQMWAHYNRVEPLPDQCEMAAVIGVPTMPDDVARGVSMFANAYGYLVFESAANDGQNKCIAYGIASLCDLTPCIYPINNGMHAVLAVGASYSWGPNNEPIAEYIEFHDPSSPGGEYVGMMADEFKNAYNPESGQYIVIIGKRMYIRTGREGYTAFSEAGGTYYGAPISNLPSTLN